MHNKTHVVESKGQFQLKKTKNIESVCLLFTAGHKVEIQRKERRLRNQVNTDGARVCVMLPSE